MLADLGDERGLQLLQESIGHFLGHGDLIHIDADLAGIEDFEESNLAGGILQVGILAHHRPIAGFATQLQRHRRQVLRRFGHHVLAHGR